MLVVRLQKSPVRGLDRLKQAARECEVWTRNNARRLQDSHGEAVRGLIGRIAIIEMVPPILPRALEPFPAPRSPAGCHSPAREQACNLPAMTSGGLASRV